MVEVSFNFDNLIKPLTDEQLESLLFAAAAEELARHQATKAARHGAQATTPREGR